MADRRLRIFHAVAKHLSFTKAADALFMTQPAVTSQVKQLEEHLNTRLFDRARGGISLTPAGQLALEYAQRILDASAELESRLQAMAGTVSGSLLIGASTTIADYLLPKVLGTYKARFPAVIPQLIVANSELVQARVDDRSLDVGFIESESHSATLALDSCCEDELRVICAPTHPLARLDTLRPDALAQYPNISREPGSGTREVIDRYLLAQGVSPDSLQRVMELGSPEALKGVVATGLGFSIMSRATVVNEVRLGQLVEIPLAPRLIRTLSLVYPKERIHSPLVSSFIDFARHSLVQVSADGVDLAHMVATDRSASAA
ncbi:MAG: LysR family transcriptional regulator [Quisquiliibacterium sp.]